MKELPPLNPALAKLAGSLIEAADSPIPGPVLEAFLPEALTVGPFTLEPPNFAQLLLLHSADSPFVTGRPVTASGLIQDVASAVYILANDFKAVREEVKRGTVADRIWETAAEIPAMSPEELQEQVAAIAKHVNKGFKTVLPMKSEGDTGGAQKKMPASAGGS